MHVEEVLCCVIHVGLRTLLEGGAIIIHILNLNFKTVVNDYGFKLKSKTYSQ